MIGVEGSDRHEMGWEGPVGKAAIRRIFGQRVVSFVGLGVLEGLASH